MSTITGHVGVVKMANHFAAMHFQGNKSFFISKTLTSDIRVAQAAAKAFADSNYLPYNPNELYLADRPTYTVIKQGTKWYPAEIHPDDITLLTHFGEEKHKRDIGNEDLEHVKVLTQAIADVNHATFLPGIGISLEKNKGPLP